MNVTLVELEFVELPHLPKADCAMNNGFLLSMWDCTCRIAAWNGAIDRFEDSGGQLNPLAIRSWAVLPKPLDDACWSERIVQAALANDKSSPNAGWLEPNYESTAVA